jgi:hypothetical protein
MVSAVMAAAAEQSSHCSLSMPPDSAFARPTPATRSRTRSRSKEQYQATLAAASDAAGGSIPETFHAACVTDGGV